MLNAILNLSKVYKVYCLKITWGDTITKKRITASETRMELYSLSANVATLENKVTEELSKIKGNFKKKTGIGTAAVQTTLATLAIGFITLGLKTVETDLQSGGILTGIGAIMLLLDFYISGK